jgi:hypothetical protein
MDEDKKLVTIAEFDNSFDADLAKLTLDNAGIESVVLGEDLAANVTFNTAIFNVEIQVMEDDVEKAKQVLAEKETSEESNEQEE